MNGIIDLCEIAINCIKFGEPHRAAWRLADAGLLLRNALETEGHSGLIGYDEPTGRGAKLPELPNG